MWESIKRLSLGLVLIAVAAAVLLWSDTSRQRSTGLRRIALVQHASQGIIDDGVRGMVDGLAQQGFVDGKNVTIRRYNAEGDVATANAIANEVASAGYDLLLTATTLGLQTVANANRDGKTKHVFALVSDPVAAGVGISREDPLRHPAHLAGFGTLQPVAETLRLAKRMFPGLTDVGVVWNPAEANSEANLKIARRVCPEIGLTLLEANAENSRLCRKLRGSLTSRGVQAIWVGGDVTAMTALDTILNAARQSQIPVFTSMPGSAHGALFDLGADYYEVGRIGGELAAKILNGTSPATIAITNVVPETILINEEALVGLKDPWHIPEDVIAKAKAAKVAAAAPATSTTGPSSAAPAKAWKVAVLEYVDSPDSEDARRGILDGLKQAGLVEGRDFTHKLRNAQGDMPTLSTLVDAALSDGADLLMTLSTPTLQAAIQRGHGMPVVFTFVANAVAAGAGKSDTDHLANVTGVPTLGPYEEVMEAVRECLPQARRVGTLFVPAEVNSVYNKTAAEAAATKRGLELVALPVNTSTEIADAALSLATQRIDAIVQIGSNLTTIAFSSIAQAADRSHLPLFGVLGGNADQGAALSVARDYYDGGVRAGHLAARVIRGESPAGLPFEPLTTSAVIVNRAAAQRQGLVIPEALLRRATVRN